MRKRIISLFMLLSAMVTTFVVAPFEGHGKDLNNDNNLFAGVCSEFNDTLKDSKKAVKKKSYTKKAKAKVVGKEYNIPNNRGFKSFMSYKAITSKSSKQYKLQQKASTGKYGIRCVNDRYCVAIGTAFNAEIGTYFDLVLENGTVLKCVVGDVKSDAHTRADNIMTASNGCVSEFLVDMNKLNSKAKLHGDMSACNKKWDSPVEKIIIYEQNALER